MSIVLDVLKKIDKNKSAPVKKHKVPFVDSKYGKGKKQKPPSIPKAPGFFRRFLKWIIILLVVVVVVLLILLGVYFGVKNHYQEKLNIAQQATKQAHAKLAQHIAAQKESVEAPIEEVEEEKEPVVKTPTQLVDEIYPQVLSYLNHGERNLFVTKVESYRSNKQVYVLLVAKLANVLGQEPSKQLVVKNLMQNAYSYYPDDLKIKIVYAGSLLKAGHTTKVIKILQQDPPPLSENQRYYLLLASAYMKQSKFYQANALYKQLVIFDPYNSRYWLGLGVSYQVLGNFENAAKAYQNALSNAPPGWAAIAYITQQLKRLNP